MIVRVDALGILLEARRVLVAEVLGGFFGQAALGRWWLPCTTLPEGEAPAEVAARTVKEQLGLELEEPVLVGARPQRVGEAWHLGLVVAGALSGEPAPSPPVTGFSLRLLGELPDQVGLWHRDDLAVLAARYERLRA
ncbi:MAG TPA: NUDIX domain-containing protein [Anaeromyxobacteraceae bacterium]